MFHNFQYSIFNFQLITNPDFGQIPYKDRYQRQEAGTSNALTPNGG
jgi:hypothetical protein